jgi:GLPGLI family protein
MKQFSIIVFTIFVVTNSFAQIKEGSVVYEKKMNMHRKITDEQMRAYISEFRSTKHVLYFSDSVSNYKPLVELESNEGGDGGRMIMTMAASMMGETTDLFKNYPKATAINIIEFGSNTYNITDSIKKQNWVLQNETKNILGYNCKKAVFKQMQQISKQTRKFTSFSMNGDREIKKDTSFSDSARAKEIEIIAWYTNDIPCPTGPEEFGGLPGLALMVDIDNGETVYTAIEIKKEVIKKEVKEPTKGKKITNEDLSKLRKKMMENMMQNGGGQRGEIRIMHSGN